MTVNTVKSYIRVAYQKIGTNTRAQAVRWALMHEPNTGRPPGRPDPITRRFPRSAEQSKQFLSGSPHDQRPPEGDHRKAAPECQPAPGEARLTWV